MPIEIYSKRLGINRCYIVKDMGCVMIDGGPPRSAHSIEKWLKIIHIKPDEIQLIVLTHGHADHVGSASRVKEITGAEIVLHKCDKDWFENGTVVWPSAASTWGQIMRSLLKPITPMLRFPVGQVDVVLGDEGLSLAEYGISGRVIHTPGHTSGSVSVLLETGDAFVGCLAHNNLPFRLNPGLPIFAEDMDRLQESWNHLLDQGARMIYPGHGNSFSADIIQKALRL